MTVINAIIPTPYVYYLITSKVAIAIHKELTISSRCQYPDDGRLDT